MNITQVKVFPVNEEKLKAYVSIVLDECFLVSDLKVIQGPNGLFISMPSKRKKNGEFKDVAHPLNRETRERMEKRILEEYDKVKTSRPSPLRSPAPQAHERGLRGRVRLVRAKRRGIGPRLLHGIFEDSDRTAGITRPSGVWVEEESCVEDESPGWPWPCSRSPRWSRVRRGPKRTRCPMARSC